MSPRLRYTWPTALSSFNGIVFSGARVLSGMAGNGVTRVSGPASSVCDGQRSGRGSQYCRREVVRRGALETEEWYRGNIGGRDARRGIKNRNEVQQARRRAEPVPDAKRATRRPISSGAPHRNQ
ncbi:hypothetical protein DF051_28585 [Burkholderia contaminans]|uniref:Uncharacterized protein n=1 Tax=Burkholderia contaminans TaxID=488447 RepID=A0A3N8PG21_9BURK|nr:hypothetical protein DF051_28585 [Burkholderia contaminans]